MIYAVAAKMRRELYSGAIIIMLDALDVNKEDMRVIDDIKEIIELQVYECIVMQLSLNELELKIDAIVSSDYSTNSRRGRSKGLSELVQANIKRSGLND